MVIIIKSSAGTQTTLCDGPGRGLDKLVGPLSDGMEIDDQHEVQPVPALRSISMRFFDRGNGRVDFSWQVTHESVSSSQALVWQWTFHTNCVRSGDLYLIEDGFKVLCPMAVLQFKSKPLGVTRILTFSVQSGVPRFA